MKKAQFFMEEFLKKIIPKELDGDKKNEWQEIQDTVLFIKDIHEQWHNVLLQAVQNTSVAGKLADSTYPTHIQNDILYVKVTSADETMLISFHANTIVRHIQNTYVRSAYAMLSEKLTKVKPIYYFR